VIAFGSTGSLRPEQYPVGTLSVPHDFFDPMRIVSCFEHSQEGHVSPGFDEPLRAELLRVLNAAGFKARDRAVYVQTQGPRFETPAEVRFLASCGDLVGMTCAHEATLFRELKVPYALVCMADNVANGLAARQLTPEEFHEGVARNLATMESVLRSVLAAFAPAPARRAKPAAQLAAPAGRADDRTLKRMNEVDLLVHARYVVPVVPEGALENYSLAVKDGVVVALLPRAQMEQHFSAASAIELPQHVVVPGFTNSHMHTGMTLLRGFADDLPLRRWLTESIWPAEAAHVSPEFVRVSAQLACAEMLRCGTTMAIDQYFFPEVIAEVFEQVGLRAQVGLPVLDFPTSFAASTDEYLEKGVALLRRSAQSPSDHVRFSWTPHAPYTVSDEGLSRIKRLAAEHRVPIQMHVHETHEEVDHSERGVPDSMSAHRSAQRTRPLANLDRLGLLDQNFLAVHMTQLSDAEVALCAHRRISIAHCPSSNLKLASGLCRVADLVAAGANVCIGTDSSSSNNSLDMLHEMRLAALLAKGVSGDAAAVPAATALRMATLNGAVAAGFGSVAGSLEPGKSADFAALRLESVETLPLYDVVSHIVYCCSRDQVEHVWVAGRQLMRNRRLLTIDEDALLERVRHWNQVIRGAAAAAKAKAKAK
jgi:5-methylthioadenosine/S-adenosylhomocysteine deaminase